MIQKDLKTLWMEGWIARWIDRQKSLSKAFPQFILSLLHPGEEKIQFSIGALEIDFFSRLYYLNPHFIDQSPKQRTHFPSAVGGLVGK